MGKRFRLPEKVREEIDQRINEIKAALASLSLSVSDVKEEAIERYKSDLNLTAALAYINQYEAQRSQNPAGGGREAAEGAGADA